MRDRTADLRPKFLHKLSAFRFKEGGLEYIYPVPVLNASSYRPLMRKCFDTTKIYTVNYYRRESEMGLYL